MDATTAQNFMKSHGYTRRIHFDGTTLSDLTGTGCRGAKISLGAGAIEFSRDMQADFVTRNLFAIIMLNRIFFAPANATFYALTTTTRPMPFAAASQSSASQVWAAFSPEEMARNLARQSGYKPPESAPRRPATGARAWLVNRLTPRR